MHDTERKNLVPGAKVRVTQQIASRDHAWTTAVEGTILQYLQQPTGSWYAHAKNDRLWLDRLKIKKSDGEVCVLNLDDYSRVEVLEPAPA